MRPVNYILCTLASLVLLGACSQHHALMSPKNPSDKLFGSEEEAGEKITHNSVINKSTEDKPCVDLNTTASQRHFLADKILTSDSNLTTNSPFFTGDLPLSPGDLLDLAIANGEGFSGQYIVNSGGFLSIPYIAPINVRGVPLKNVTEKIELALVRAELFQASNALVNLGVLQLAEIEVTVSGAVFQPGRVQINRKIPEQILEERVRANGDHSGERMLSEALRAASGVRPDARLDQVTLLRHGWQVRVDMSGIFTGETVNDIALVAGDRIIVPTTGCFQAELVRPTQITPKGMRVFMSNLIDSAENNAAAAVGRFSSNLPYGTRLLQAAVSANCVGGKQWTNAPRKVLLASTNPLTGEIQVVERSVEKLIRQAHLYTENPYLMPNDAIACYDSNITNLRDVARTLGELVSPFKLGK